MSNKAKKRLLKYQQLNNFTPNPQNEVKNPDLKFWTNTLIVLSLTLYIILSFPFLKDQIMAGHDSGAHFNYAKVFQKTISDGQFPVRLINWLTPGLDQPLFNFYQPGFYYINYFIFSFLGLNLVLSINLTNLILYLVSAILMFVFVRGMFGALAGVLSAAFYAFAPYHLSDIFVRAAYPEAAALAFVPGIFWASERFIKTKRIYWLSIGSLFVGLTLISHPPTMLMFSLPILLFVLFLTTNLKTLITVLGSYVLGFSLAGFFIIPAILEQPLIQSSWLKIGYYDFHQHFACLPQIIWSNWGYGISTQGCTDGFSFQLGLLHWLIFIFLICIYIYSIFRKTQKKLIGWVLIVSFLGIFLTMEISKTVWENTPFFPFIQYPWRFLILPVFALSFGSAFLIQSVKLNWLKLATFACLIVLIPIFYGWFARPSVYYSKDVFEQQIANYPPEYGYFPKWVAHLPDPANLSDAEVKVESGEGEVTKIKSSSTYKQWTTNSKSPLTLQLLIHYFPNWEVKIDNAQTKIDYQNEFGFITINVPQGQHLITATYHQTLVQQISNTISALALMLIISLPVIFIINNKEMILKFRF